MAASELPKTMFASGTSVWSLPDAAFDRMMQARAELQKAALQFEETSRWLAALQVMQAEEG